VFYSTTLDRSLARTAYMSVLMNVHTTESTALGGSIDSGEDEVDQ